MTKVCKRKQSDAAKSPNAISILFSAIERSLDALKIRFCDHLRFSFEKKRDHKYRRPFDGAKKRNEVVSFLDSTFKSS